MVEGGFDGGDVDRAHRAEILGHDQVGGEVVQCAFVKVVEVLAGGEAGSDFRVDFGWAQTFGQGRGGDDTPRPGLGREVAFEGHSDHVVSRAEGEEDLRCRRQRRHNPHDLRA